jgi:hypothetical protein
VTAEKYTERINAYAKSANHDKGKLRDDTCEYYLTVKFKEGTLRSFNSLNFIKAVNYAVSNYDQTRGIPFLNYLGDTIKTRKNDIFARRDDKNETPPEDTRAPGLVKTYYKFTKVARELGIDFSSLSEQDIVLICEKANIPRGDFGAIIRAGNSRNPISLFDPVGDDAVIDDIIADDDDGFGLMYVKIGLMEWFVWLSKQTKAQKKLPIFHMINTNCLVKLNIEIWDFDEHTDVDYFMHLVEHEKEPEDVTIVVYIGTSKENFSATYKKPYKNFYAVYQSKQR